MDQDHITKVKALIKLIDQTQKEVDVANHHLRSLKEQLGNQYKTLRIFCRINVVTDKVDDIRRLAYEFIGKMIVEGE